MNPEMRRFVGDLTSKGVRWVPIVDPAIKVDKGYEPYDVGIQGEEEEDCYKEYAQLRLGRVTEVVKMNGSERA